MDKIREKTELLLIGFKHRFARALRGAAGHIADEEGADMVEIVLGIALFAVVAILVSKGIGGAIEAKGREAASVIESASFR